MDAGLGALLAVDLTTGNRTVLSDDATGTGPDFNLPGSIALDEANDWALVVDGGGGLDALLAVNLSNGDRAVLADDAVGTGQNFSAPTSITLDAANDRALVVDSGLEALLVFELGTGERAIASR